MAEPEGRTHCKHGHGIEHQRLNTRGHKICGLCARADILKYALKNQEKIRARWRAGPRGVPDMTRFPPKRIKAMRIYFTFIAEQRCDALTCQYGHAWASNTMFKFGRRRCRECARIDHKEEAKTRIATEEKVSQVLEGLSHGLTINQMTASSTKKGVYRNHAGITKIVGPGPLYNFFRAHPALGKKMKDTSKKNAIKNLKEACLSRRVVAAPALMRNNGVDAFEAVRRATAGIWEGDRDDVQALVWIDIAENKLKISDCAPEKAREYLKIHRRRPNVFGSYSLDTPIGEDSGMTWLDTKTDEDRLWA